jgi:hypothetical protein
LSFILRIFFSGLIAFVPSEDGKELNVLLLDTARAHHAAIGAVPEHMPLLLVRGANCDGNCGLDPGVAEHLYPDVTSADAATASLTRAVSGGVAWHLAGSQIDFATPNDGVTLLDTTNTRSKRVPATAGERAGFNWVPDLKELNPSVGPLDRRVFSAEPPPGLIVGRLRLTSGIVSTYSVIQIDGKVTPVDFRPAGSNAKAVVSRAAANWVEAEIRMTGNSMTLIEQSFDGKDRRSVTLSPRNGMVEMAVLNISRPGARTGPPQPGTHFSLYWELAEHPPAQSARPIPQVPRDRAARTDWAPLHPSSPERGSDLLDELLFPGGRGPYDQILCPMSQYSPP